MSVAAMTWAFGLELKPSSLKFLLVALADNADDQGRAFPSVECLAFKTGQDRKTVISGLDRLEKLGLATDTGSRVGRTKQVKVYRLERFAPPPNNTESGTIQQTNDPKIGTVQTSKDSENGTVSQSQTVPNFPSNSTVFPGNSTVFPLKGSQKRDTEPSDNHQKEPSEGTQERAHAREAGVADPAAEVFNHWRQTHHHPGAQLDAKRRKLLATALKSYDVATLCESITGYLNSPHHMGQNERATVYDDIEIFLRDAKHIDAGLKFARAPPRQDLSPLTRRNVAAISDWQPPELRNATK